MKKPNNSSNLGGFIDIMENSASSSSLGGTTPVFEHPFAEGERLLHLLRLRRECRELHRLIMQLWRERDEALCTLEVIAARTEDTADRYVARDLLHRLDGESNSSEGLC